MPYLFSCSIAFAVTISCIYLLRPLAIRLGLVDTPRGRKQHQGNVPLIGGIAMFLGFLFALLTLPISLEHYRSFIAGCALLVFIGVLDDFKELSARARLIAQIAAGLLMTLWGGIVLQDLGSLLFYKNILLGIMGLPLTVLAVVGLINAVNMMDGVDGLAGSLVLIALGFLLFFALQANLIGASYILAVCCAILFAFLLFNFSLPGRPTAKIFMGDAGSMLLGFTLVWFLVEFSQKPHFVANPVFMLWIVAIPLFDMVGVTLYRLKKKASPFAPGREHLHHLLQEMGFTPIQVVLMLCMVALVMGLIGIVELKMGVSEGGMFCSFLALFFVYLGTLSYLRKRI